MSQKSIFEELKPFAKMVIDQGRGVTVSDLAFASAEDRWSTAFIDLSTLTYPAATSVKLFQTNVGEQGQGSASITAAGLALTVAETNNTNGDRMPANQVYIGTHVGFQLYAVTGALSCVPICNPHDAYQIASNTTWALMVGDGIQRTLGTILEYPAGCGIDAMYAVGSTTLSGASPSSIAWANNGWVGADKRRLPIPIVWPPNVQVDIELKTGNAQTLLNNLGSAVTQGPQSYSGGQIAIRCTFKGFRMTLPA